MSKEIRCCMKKLFASCLSVLILVFSVIPVAAASAPAPVSVMEEDPIARAEQTTWVFRTTPDGKNQMRLWSITYGRWLTDWITIN